MRVVNDPDTLVGDYLGRLEQAAQVLPADRRTELVEEVRAHIAEARTAGADDLAAVRTVLDRLGSPDEIVAAAREDAAGDDRAPADGREPERRLRVRDVATLLLLPFGGFLFVVGWFLGVVLLWSSDRWRTPEKWLGTMVIPFGYLGLFAMSTLPAQTCVSGPEATSAGAPATVPVAETCDGFAFSPWVGVPLFVVLLVGPALAVGLLAMRAAPGRG